MMKKLAFSCCLAFGLVQGDCWGMEKEGVVHPSVLRSIEHSVGVKTFSNSDDEAEMICSTPIQNDEMQAAINKWAHLVPDDATTTQVNETLQEVIIHMGSPERKHKMEALVELICNPDNRSTYANYVHMVFIDALSGRDDEEENKFGGMLAGIAGCKGGTASLFWNWYAKGYFDSMPLEAE